MSLPSFKFTNLGAPTNNESVNSGLSSLSKMKKSGLLFDTKSNILAGIKEKAQDTFKDVELPSIDVSVGGDDDDGSSDGGFFSFGTLIKLILIVVIIWFMWSSLSSNSDFHLGMGDVGNKVVAFFKSMEDKGRQLISRMTNTPLPRDDDGDDSDDSDSDEEGDSDRAHPASRNTSSTRHQAPVPPSTTNSSDKKPGFVTDETKYTFLDKADRNYTGPAPRADDSTSVTQKHQTGKGGYCYIGEDRGFRSCVKVDASDKCMSGEVFSRHDICVNPTLRE
jgi:hypothetical protein